ncbi:MAG: LysR family transcriptional regulator [Kofleriaceae bacterium]
MDLNELVVFAKVAETRSFTAAADELGLPKSTVSRKIAQLEERLGVRLLQRTTRKLALTEVGTTYYERCTRIVADIIDAERAVTDMQASPQGLLRVSAPVDIAGSFLGPIAAAFTRRYPEIQLELDAADRVVDLIEEAVDVAIRVGPLSDSSLVARRLTTLSTVVVAAPDYLAAHGEPRSAAELAAHAVVLFAPNGRRTPWTLTGPDGALELGPPARLMSSSLLAVVDATLAGAGVAILPDFHATGHLAAGRLRRILPAWDGEPRDLFAVYPSTRNLSPKLRVFLDHLIAAFDPPPWSARPG